MRDAAPTINGRISAARTLGLVSGLGLLLSGGLLTGCATTLDLPVARRSEGLPSANRGQSSAVVFSGPAIAAAMTQVPDWVRPEYARNNGTLALAEPRALTAIDTWPQVPPPTIAAQRRTTLNRNPQQIIIFTRPGAGRGGAWSPGGRYGPRRGPVGGRWLHTPRPR
jgi:hypothetical protein